MNSCKLEKAWVKKCCRCHLIDVTPPRFRARNPKLSLTWLWRKQIFGTPKNPYTGDLCVEFLEIVKCVGWKFCRCNFSFFSRIVDPYDPYAFCLGIKNHPLWVSECQFKPLHLWLVRGTLELESGLVINSRRFHFPFLSSIVVPVSMWHSRVFGLQILTYDNWLSYRCQFKSSVL